VPKCKGMPQPFESYVNAFFHWFKGRYQAMIALLVLSASALFAPRSLTDAIQIGDQLRQHRFLEVGCFAFSAIYLLIGMGDRLIRRVGAWRHLQSLADDERRVFQSFITGDRRTRGFIENAFTATAMAKMDLLEVCESIPKNVNDRRGVSYFTIKPWVFRYLKKRPQMFAPREMR
jgi:hypothetical protein